MGYKNRKYVYSLSGNVLNKNCHLKEQPGDGRIILEWISGKQVVRIAV